MTEAVNVGKISSLVGNMNGWSSLEGRLQLIKMGSNKKSLKNILVFKGYLRPGSLLSALLPDLAIIPERR